MEKGCYRKANYKYRVKLKELNTENDRLLEKCEFVLPALQEENQRLKATLEEKDKLCKQLQQRIIDLEMSNRIKDSESDEWVASLSESDDDSDNDKKPSVKDDKVVEKFIEKLNTIMTKKPAKKPKTETTTEIEETTKTEEPIEKTETMEKTETTTIEKPKTVKKLLVEEISLVKTPNDLLMLRPKPICTNPDSQVNQPPSSPKKRTRSLSPLPANNLPPDSSPLLIPVMTDTLNGPGHSVKRKRRKK